MAERVKPRRSYDSSGRQEQAREARLRILRAAHDLFVTQGYGHTTIADIARAAGVSAESVYASFKNKITVLHRVWDITIGGDDEEAVFHDRPEIMAIRQEPDLGRRFTMHAAMSTRVARRIGPFLLALRGAAGSDPAAADMLAEIDRQRLVGMGVMASEAAKTGQLAVTEEQCRDLIWATTDGMLWHRLVQERGWTDEAYAELIATMWRGALVAKPSRRRT